MMKVLSNLPFTHHRRGEVKVTVDYKAIIQALIIASASSAMVMYGTQKTLSVEMASVKEDINDLKIGFSRMRDDFYEPRK